MKLVVGRKIDPSRPLYQLLSHMKLVVGKESILKARQESSSARSSATTNTDDEGIAFIEQVLIQDQATELLRISYRVKFGRTEKELTRSIRRGGKYGFRRDQKISDLIAKL